MMGTRSGAAAVALALIFPVAASALDVPISARKLVVKTEPATAKRRFLFKTVKEPAVVVAADPTVGGANLFAAGLSCAGPDCSVAGSAGTIHLPAGDWKALGNPPGSRGYRYKDRDGIAGGVRVVVLKPGKLVVKAAGPNWPWLPAGGEDAVAVTMQIGADRYCAEFGGTEKINEPGRLSFRNADAPSTCRVLCGNDVQESAEQCDGNDSAACSGLCQSDCTCPTPVCGNGVVETGEECDGAPPQPFLVCEDCQGCLVTNSPGCDLYPCCNPEAFCRLPMGPGDTATCALPSALGEGCGQVGEGAQPCEEGLFCQPEEIIGPGFFLGSCCSADMCSANADCCFGGICATGQCCTQNGSQCGTFQGFVFRCCTGQVCCDGANCPDLDFLSQGGGIFLATCCGDVGSACTTGSQCCSGTCDTGGTGVCQ